MNARLSTTVKLYVERKYTYWRVLTSCKDSYRTGAFDEEVSEIEGEIQHNQVQFDKIDDEIKLCQQINNQITNTINDLINTWNQCSRNIQTLITTNNHNYSSIDLIIANIDQIQQFQVKDKMQELDIQIKQFEVQVKQNQDIIDDKLMLIISKTKILNSLIRFKTHLSNTAIGVIEAQVNEYLTRMGSDLKLILEGYKTNKGNKQIVEKITPLVMRTGTNVKFGTLSSGEKARIDVAIILSLQKLINANAVSGGGLDLCFLDEIIESVDSLGMEGLMRSLDSLHQTIIVVTHGTFDKVYDNTIKVTKTKELGSIIDYESTAA